MRMRFINVFLHFLLADFFQGDVIGFVDYIIDDSVSELVSNPCGPNVVGIVKENYGPEHQRIILNMFNKHTIALDFKGNRVTVRYPGDAPVRLMLDDVLQAALQPMLAGIGGFILHGSCMVHDGIAIAFMGNSGSGKSTTAFNLMRYGFFSYADDAVLVVPDNEKLCVWPLAREFSIRPLSFNLLRQYGISINDYTRDGEKYYFTQDAKNCARAVLKHICFVEISGEENTVVKQITSEETLRILLKNNRHFSFMGRESAAVYSKILAEKVAAPLIANAGTNLDLQGTIIKDIVLGRETPVPDKCRSTKPVTGRKQKRAIIQKAWSSAGREPLEDLIPLLGDFDGNIFALALSFFQTFPLAHIRPLISDIRPDGIPQKFEADWMRSAEWIEGCRKLLNNIGVEVLQRFALPWIKSAPLIYPFLRLLASEDPQKDEQLELAWELYNKENTASCKTECTAAPIHITNLSPEYNDTGCSSALPENIPAHIYCWIVQGEPFEFSKVKSLFETIGMVENLTIVPVGSAKENVPAAALDFMRQALAAGLKPKISRFTPLCKINADNAAFILDSGAFENEVSGCFSCTEPQKHTILGGQNPAQLPDRLDNSIQWVERPFSACEACGLYALGLCQGGYFIKS